MKSLKTLEDYIDAPKESIYRAMVLGRLKDNPELGKSTKVFDILYDTSLETLVEKAKKKANSIAFKTRVYVDSRPSDLNKVALEVISLTADYLKSNNLKTLHNIYDKAFTRKSCKVGNKTFILDYDGVDESSVYVPEYITKYKTPNGFHAVIKPRDIRDLAVAEVKRNSPFLLYYNF